MYSIVRQSDSVTRYLIECVVDTLEDVATLPTNWKAGSTCIVIEGPSVFMLGNDEIWHNLSEEEEEA